MSSRRPLPGFVSSGIFFADRVQKACDRCHPKSGVTEILRAIVFLDMVSTVEKKGRPEAWKKKAAGAFVDLYARDPFMVSTLLAAIKEERRLMKKKPINLRSLIMRLSGLVHSGYHESKRVPAGSPLGHKEIADLAENILGRPVTANAVRQTLYRMAKSRRKIISKWERRFARRNTRRK